MHPTNGCKLHTAIYGFKQAPRAWYTEFKNYLVTLGFVKSQSDSSLFILHNFEFIVYIFAYVDDIIVTGNQISGVHNIIANLATRFSLKDHGPLHYFLGVEVLPYPGGLYMCKQRYIADLLKEVSMHNCKVFQHQWLPLFLFWSLLTIL